MGAAGLIESAIRELMREETREIRGMLQTLLEMLRPERGGVAPAADQYLNTEAAARIAGVKPQTIQRWVRRGELHAYRAGRVLRIRLAELEGFLSRTSKSKEQGEEADLEERALLIISRKKRLHGEPK